MYRVSWAPAIFDGNEFTQILFQQDNNLGNNKEFRDADIYEPCSNLPVKGKILPNNIYVTQKQTFQQKKGSL